MRSGCAIRKILTPKTRYNTRMSDLQIRDANPKDAVGIATVHVRTWQCAYKGQISQAYLDSLSVEQRRITWEQALSEPDPGVHVIVATLGEKVVGWSTYGTSRDEDATQETGELHGIYVDPDYIGKGIGSALMEAAVAGLKKDGYIKTTLWVLDTNEKTRKFYEKMGWVEQGMQKDDPRDGFTLHEIRYVRDIL